MSRLSPSSLSRVDRSQIPVARRLGFAFRWGFRKDSSGHLHRKAGSDVRTLNAKISKGGSAQDLEGRFRLRPFLSLYFLRLKFKLESRGTGVGYEMPTVEALSGTDYCTAPPGLLREPGSAADIGYSAAPSGLLREPDSIDNFSRKHTSPGLLHKPGSAADIDYMTTPLGLLRDPDSVTDNSNSYEQTSPGLLREPGSAADIDYGTAPPGLLWEPGYTADIDYRTAPPGLLRELGSAADIDYRTAPPRLL